MKVSILFILLLFLVSCNRNQSVKVVSKQDSTISHIEVKSESIPKNIIRNQPSAIKQSKVLMAAKKGIRGTYWGTIGANDFKLVIEKVFGEEVEGYCVSVSKTRKVKGRIVNKSTELLGQGHDVTIYRLNLSEPTTDKQNGAYILNLIYSEKSISGEGNWRSYNEKQESYIKSREQQRSALINIVTISLHVRSYRATSDS